jgi:hypothetical protein
MNEHISIYKICEIDGVWKSDNRIDAVEICAIGESIFIRRQSSEDVLIFDLDEWEEINKFIAEELEANAEPDS